VKPDGHSAFEEEIGDAQARDLRDTRARVVEDREEDCVSSAAPRRSIRRVEDGVNLLAREGP
jgi:hypothetical protein